MASERAPRPLTPPRGEPRVPRAANHERLVFRLTLLAGLPAVVVAMVLLWRDGYSGKVQWTLGLVVLGSWLITAFVLRERVVRPLQTLSNMLAALREGDYSIRARGADREDALGLAFLESNLLGETLRTQRLGAMEATALLRSVMAEIDVAVFAVDDDDRVRLVNRAGERLLGQPAERLLGRTADQVGLAETLQGSSPRTMDVTFAGGAGRWEVRRGPFRQDGRPHTLLVLADVSKALREEELQAWQRLVRVLSHEINNSLAPIKSITGSLTALLERHQRPSDADDDLRRGLMVIGGRVGGARSLHVGLRAAGAVAGAASRAARHWYVGASCGGARDANARGSRSWTADDGSCRWRSARSTLDQPRAQRGGRGAGDERCRAHLLAASERFCRADGRRRGTGNREQREPVRAVFYDEAARVRALAWCSVVRSPRRMVGRCSSRIASIAVAASRRCD